MGEGNLIGHSFYDDDVDFDLIPMDAKHVRTADGAVFEFIPPAAGHHKEWLVTGDYGHLRGTLRSQAPPTTGLRSAASPDPKSVLLNSMRTRVGFSANISVWDTTAASASSSSHSIAETFPM